MRDELRLTIIEQENKHVFVQVLLKGMMYQLDSMLSLAANTFVYIFLFPITSFYLIPLFTHKCSLIKIVQKLTLYPSAEKDQLHSAY